MHRFLITCLLLCSVCSAEPQVRFSLQFIEVTHPVLTELLAGEDQSGKAMHAKAVSMSKEGKAKIVETFILTGHHKQKLTLESIREEIYPTAYHPVELPHSIGNGPHEIPNSPDPTIRNNHSPTAFETRNTGVTFNVESEISQDARAVELTLSSEVVIPVRLDMITSYRDRWGDASFQMPVYEKWGSNTKISVTPGQFGLVSVIHPKPVSPAPALSRRILVFVRADILKTP